MNKQQTTGKSELALRINKEVEQIISLKIKQNYLEKQKVRDAINSCPIRARAPIGKEDCRLLREE